MAKTKDIQPPVIDSRIEFSGPSKLREFNGEKLREFTDNVLVIQDGGDRVAVLMGYDLYIRMQEAAA